MGYDTNSEFSILSQGSAFPTKKMPNRVPVSKKREQTCEFENSEFVIGFREPHI